MKIERRSIPSHVKPKNWCVRHHAIRKTSGWRPRCVEAWGDSFVDQRCVFGDGIGDTDE